MKVNLRLIKGIYLLFLMVLLPGSLYAQDFTAEELAFIQSSPVVTLKFLPHRAPYSYRGKNEAVQGVSVEMLKMVSRISGLQFSCEMLQEDVLPVDYLAEHPDELMVDVLTDDHEDAEKQYIHSEFIYIDSISLVARRGKRFESPADGNNYSLVIPHTYVTLESYIRNKYPGFTILYCSTVSDGLNMVLAGKADFMAQNMTVLLNELSRPKYYTLMLLPNLFMNDHGCIAAFPSERNALCVSIINKSLALIDDNQKAEMMLQHTLETSYQFKVSDILYLCRIQILVIILLLAVSIFLLVSWIHSRDRHYEEISRMNTRLLFAMEQANEAAQAKSRFLLRISHDIRTPMNAIAGSVDLAEMLERRNDASMQNRMEIFDRIRTATASMEKLVDDVISRANALEGFIELKEQSFHLGTCIAGLNNELQMAVCGRVNWVSSRLNKSLDCQVIGDEGKLNEILDLLVEWIACYPHPLRSISFSAACRDIGEEHLYCTMKIAVVAAQSVKEHDDADSHRIPLINVVDIMGGAVSFDVYNDICCDVSITVPFKRENTAAAAEQKSESEAITDLLKFKGTKPLKLLIVDDNDINVAIVSHLLSACQISSDAVYNGRDGIAAIEKSDPGTYDAVLMDIRMPVMNGNDATLAIRHSAHPDGKTLPIYAFSANYATSDIAASINAGVNGYLKKPLEVHKLVKILYSLV